MVAVSAGSAGGAADGSAALRGTWRPSASSAPGAAGRQDQIPAGERGGGQVGKDMCAHGRTACDGGGAQRFQQKFCPGRWVAVDGRLGEFPEHPGGAAEVAGLPEDRKHLVEQHPRSVRVPLKPLVARPDETGVRKLVFELLAGSVRFAGLQPDGYGVKADLSFHRPGGVPRVHLRRLGFLRRG